MSSLEDVVIPDIGDFAEVPVIEILVQPGDVVTVEDPLLMLESDKAVMEVPSPLTGTVKEVLVSVGDTVSEGTRILTIEAIEAREVAWSDSTESRSGVDSLPESSSSVVEAHADRARRDSSGTSRSEAVASPRRMLAVRPCKDEMRRGDAWMGKRCQTDPRPLGTGGGGVVVQEGPDALRHGEHPLAHRKRRHDVIDEMGCRLDHTAGVAGWTHATALATERDQEVVATPGAAGASEAVRQNAATQVGSEVSLDPRGDAVPHGVRLGLAPTSQPKNEQNPHWR